MPCGVGGFGGNKGAACVSLQLHRQRLLFLNCHFAAHQARHVARLQRAETLCIFCIPDAFLAALLPGLSNVCTTEMCAVARGEPQ